jgi:PAS domain S-box-containing protein
MIHKSLVTVYAHNSLKIREIEFDLNTGAETMQDKPRESNENNFMTLLNFIVDPAVIVDGKGHFLVVNNAIEELTGLSKKELIGKSFFEVINLTAESKARLLEKLMKRMQGLSVEPYEITFTDKTGETRYAEVKAKKIDYAGQPADLVIFRDITRRKKNLAKLKEYSEKLEALVDEKVKEIKQERDKLEAVTENIGAGLIIISKDYHTLWANEFIKRYKGDVEGKLCYATLNTLDNICPDCGVKKVFENGATIDTHEYTSTDIRGNPYWVELIATPIKDKDGNVMAALELAVDITEKKRMQSELAEYSQKLEKLVDERTEQLEQTHAKLVKSERLAAIGELAGMVGHDLRNPLTGIKGALYYLKTKYGAETDVKGKEMFEVIDKDIDYSNKIINDLLDYSRDLTLELVNTTPKLLLKNALSLIEVPERIKIIDAAEEKPEIKADAGKMNRAFVNIITNAIDAMPETGTLTVTSKAVKGNV